MDPVYIVILETQPLPVAHHFKKNTKKALAVPKFPKFIMGSFTGSDKM